MEGFDYAWGFSSSLPKALAQAGAKFVVRYLGTSSKCLTASETASLRAAGIGIGLVYETTGATFTGGLAAGQKDGAAAMAAAQKLGVPDGTPIFFAIDTDTSDYATVKNYLTGCQQGSGPYAARLYAGFHVIEAVGGTGHWQTYAWSGTNISAHAGLYQYHNGVTVGGVSMDNDRTLTGGPGLVNGWLTYIATTPAPPGGTVLPSNKDWARLKGNKNPKGAQALKNAQKESAHPTHNYKGLCLVFVRTCYGLAADGREPDATSSWSDAGKTHQHTYYNAPAGVPVVWSGGGSGHGHIAIADGHGNVLTTDFGPQGYIGDGHVRLVPLASIVQHDPALHYLGWIGQLEGASVYTQG